MKIKSIQVSLHHLPLTKPYTIAYKTMVDTEIVMLEITLDNGISGLGAANPFEDVVGETPQQTFELLQTGYLDNFIGKNIEDFLDLITQAAAHFDHKPGALAAIDIALHDLYCKYKGISVLDFYGKCMQALPTSITIGIKPLAEMLEEARGYEQLGFKILKIKTGLNVDEDIERVAKISELFGNSMLIWCYFFAKQYQTRIAIAFRNITQNLIVSAVFFDYIENIFYGRSFTDFRWNRIPFFS